MIFQTQNSDINVANVAKLFMKCISNKAYLQTRNNWIVYPIEVGNRIRGISMLLAISTNTVLNRILQISKQIKKTPISFNKEFEVDEIKKDNF